jgi:hypothetical protein
MHDRRARWLVPFLTASLLVSASASAALAHKGRRGGKKPRGVVTSFDAGSMALAVELRNGDTFEGIVDPDVQVKLEHRGRHSHAKDHGNPSNGSVEDIVPGALVLRMKFDDEGVVDKLRLRPAEEDPCASDDDGDVEEPEVEEADEGSEVEEPEDGTPTEPTAKHPAEEDEAEDVCEEDPAGDDVEDDEVGDDSGDEPVDEPGDEPVDDSGDGV